jgi:tetratricopeptide (TPR) repeat protein
MIGEVIHQYRITEQIGQGGMGIVYRALDTKLDRDVALKFLPPHASADPDTKARFILEAKAASQLDHPNVCTIHDISETDDGRLFMVMPFYDGQTLKYLLEDGALPESEARGIGLQLARGLKRAHEAGIVHRDIKPANILLTGDGTVKILDFGVAKLGEASDLTKMGSTVGTAAYMSPEQARAEEVDARTDLWSLGVLLHEMLTGTPTFGGGYGAAVAYAVLNQEPGPLPEGVSDEVRALVARLLSKDRDERPASADEVIESLSDGVSPLRAPAPIPRSPGRLILAAAGALAVSAVLFVWLTRSPAEPVTERLDAIAVMPFDIQGGEGIAYLERGIMTLLGDRLDGVAGFRAVDPNALLGYLRNKQGQFLGPEDGLDVARQFRANQFILGSVVQEGSAFELRATLYGSDGEQQTLAKADFREDESISLAIDQVAGQLLQRRLLDTGASAARSVTGTSGSYAAIKAYVEGTEAMRLGEFREACVFSRASIMADSTYANAWYLYGRVNGWITNCGRVPQKTPDDWRSGLNPRTRELSSIRGTTYLDREAAFLSYLDRYPDDIEALGSLGDFFYHSGPFVRVPTSRAIPFMLKVLEYDPDNREYLWHLADLASDYRRYGLADTLRALIADDTLTRDNFQINARTTLALLAVPFDRAREVGTDRVREAIDNGRVRANSFWGLPRHAYVAAGKTPTSSWVYDELGMYVEAQRRTSEQPSPRGASIAINRAALPDFQVSPDSLRAWSAIVAQWDTTSAPRRLGRIPGQQLDAREYVVGQAAFLAGDESRVTEAISFLSRRAIKTGEDGLAIQFAKRLEGLQLWRERRLDEARDALERGVTGSLIHAITSISMVGPFERYVLADLRMQEGEFGPALALYRSIGDGLSTAPAPMWEGYSRLGMAEAYEAMGQFEAAAAAYARVIETWELADPEIQPRVEYARQRLDAMAAAVARERT